MQCSENVEYLNARATFVDPTTVEIVDSKGATKKISSDTIVIAVGGRPRYLEIPGVEHCVTSDDIFSLDKPPGKTLVVGASYVALECAGFLNGIGFEVCVLVRSEVLRGFDREMVAHVTEDMKHNGVRFVDQAEPVNISINKNGRKECTWIRNDSAETDDFDTVLLAVGREPCTRTLGLKEAAVTVNPKNWKIPTKNDQTNVPNIYAIGDVVDETSLNPPTSLTELTPVAIRTGRLLADRLYGGASTTMDYDFIPTAVFTPLEYGLCGLSEEAAINLYGKGCIEVYHSYFKPLEWALTASGREDRGWGYVKLICNLANSSRIVGLHVCGPNSAEITQGFALAMRMGATKADFDSTLGLHPTVAEVFTTLSTTKSSCKKVEPAGC